MKRVPECSCGQPWEQDGVLMVPLDISCPIHQPPPIIPAISNTSRIDYHRKARPERL